MSKPNKPIHPKPGSQTVATPRRNSRTITNVPIQQQPSQNLANTAANDQHGTGGGKDNNANNHKLFAFESFDDSIRRFQRLREIRKNLRTKYDEQPTPSVQVRFRHNHFDFIQNSDHYCLAIS